MHSSSISHHNSASPSISIRPLNHSDFVSVIFPGFSSVQRSCLFHAMRPGWWILKILVGSVVIKMPENTMVFYLSARLSVDSVSACLPQDGGVGPVQSSFKLGCWRYTSA